MKSCVIVIAFTLAASLSTFARADLGSPLVYDVFVDGQPAGTAISTCYNPIIWGTQPATGRKVRFGSPCIEEIGVEGSTLSLSWPGARGAQTIIVLDEAAFQEGFRFDQMDALEKEWKVLRLVHAMTKKANCTVPLAEMTRMQKARPEEWTDYDECYDAAKIHYPYMTVTVPKAASHHHETDAGWLSIGSYLDLVRAESVAPQSKDE